jgi:cytidine deaminase
MISGGFGHPNCAFLDSLLYSLYIPNRMKVKRYADTYTRLIKAALRAKNRSYSPYSKFRVGAALLTSSGKIYTGCNIESSSFSLTICAERTALFKAVSESQKKFKAIAIASDAKDFISPCGACRQVILDLAGNIDVVLSNRKGATRVMKMANLLPLPFDGRELRQ